MPTDRARAKGIVNVYAETLFEAARADDSVDAAGAALVEATRVVRGSAELRDVLRDESIPAATRRSIIEEVFAGSHPALRSMVGLMAERGEVDLLSAVEERFAAIAEERRGAVVVDVTTVVPLTDALRASITDKLSADLGKSVVLRESVDPSILGGIIISAHGRRIDASISSQLERARVALSTAHTGGEA